MQLPKATSANSLCCYYSILAGSNEGKLILTHACSSSFMFGIWDPNGKGRKYLWIYDLGQLLVI